jgi:hypothetical protein
MWFFLFSSTYASYEPRTREMSEVPGKQLTRPTFSNVLRLFVIYVGLPGRPQLLSGFFQLIIFFSFVVPSYMGAWMFISSAFSTATTRMSEMERESSAERRLLVMNKCLDVKLTTAIYYKSIFFSGPGQEFAWASTQTSSFHCDLGQTYLSVVNFFLEISLDPWPLFVSLLSEVNARSLKRQKKQLVLLDSP